MGRPPKYSSEKERAIARREQNRLNVRAYRQRSKYAVQEKTPSLQSSTSESSRSESADSEELERLAPAKVQVHVRGNGLISSPVLYQKTIHEASPSPYLADIAPHSFSAPIELSFGLLQAVTNYFYHATGCFPWIDAIQEFRTEDRVVDIAILSAGSRWLGRMMGDQRMTNFARSAHHKTLQLLRSHLENFDTREALLLNTVNVALSAFETLDDSSKDGLDSKKARIRWISHFEGGMAMMKQAGPQAYQSRLGLEILRGFRPRIMFAATFSRQPSFLDDDQWRIIPYIGSKLTKRDELWQLAERIPRYLQRVDELKFESDEFDRAAQLPKARELWGDLVALRRTFEDWLINYGAENAIETEEALWWSQSASHSIILGSIDTFPTVLYFPNRKVSDIVVNYWDALLQLLCASLEVQEYLVDIGYADVVASAQLYEGDLLLIAQSICKSMECVFGPDERDLRGVLYSGLLPLRSAWQYFANNPTQYARELRWCELIRKEIEKRGIGGGWLEQLFIKKATHWEKKRPSRYRLGKAIEASKKQDVYINSKLVELVYNADSRHAS